MTDAVVRKNSLKFNGKNYFRVGAESTVVGAVGVKRTPIAKGNYLEVKDRIRSGKLKLREIGPVQIDAQSTSRADFMANINLAKIFGNADVDVAYRAVCDNQLDLVFFSIDTNDLVDAINRSPSIREDLARWGDDARVVSGGFLIVKATTTHALTVAAHVEARFNDGGLTIAPELGASTDRSTEVEFPVGACFAYDLSRLVWLGGNARQATQVVDLERDDHGL